MFQFTTSVSSYSGILKISFYYTSEILILLKSEFKKINLNTENCPVYKSIELIKKIIILIFLLSLKPDMLFTGDRQFLKGIRCSFASEHISELHFLEIDFKIKFLNELTRV